MALIRRGMRLLSSRLYFLPSQNQIIRTFINDHDELLDGDQSPLYSTDDLIVRRLDRARYIAFNLPNRTNRLDESNLENLTKAIENFENSHDRMAVLYGRFGSFCSGLDASEEAKLEFLQKFNKRKKPVVAAVSGFALDFGFELAVFCDIRIMEESARMGLNKRREEYKFSPKFYQCLLASVGLQNSLDIMLTARNQSGIEAQQKGLALIVCNTGTALGTATSYVNSIQRYRLKDLIEHRKNVYEAACLWRNN